MFYHKEHGLYKHAAAVQDTLDLTAILAQLTPAAKKWLQQVRAFTQIDSTNQYLLDHPQTDMVISDQQYAGRGQKDRSWYSPAGENIYLSVRWQTKVHPDIDRTMIIVAKAIQQLCFALSIKNCTIKRPNDVMIDGKKAAGILIEAVTQGSNIDLVIGIGVNVWMQHPAADASPDYSDPLPIHQPWTSLAEAARNAHASLAEHPGFNRTGFNRNSLTSKLLNILHVQLCHELVQRSL